MHIASLGISLAAATEEIAFDKAVASSVLSAVDLAKCKSTNASRGEGHIFVKLTAAGVAAEAVVDKGPWLKTPVAKCIATEFKNEGPDVHGRRRESR